MVIILVVVLVHLNSLTARLTDLLIINLVPNSALYDLGLEPLVCQNKASIILCRKHSKHSRTISFLPDLGMTTFPPRCLCKVIFYLFHHRCSNKQDVDSQLLKKCVGRSWSCWVSWGSDCYAWRLDSKQYITSRGDIVSACVQSVTLPSNYGFDISLDLCTLQRPWLRLFHYL